METKQELTVEQLEAMLAEKKKEVRNKRAQERTEYEKMRNQLVTDVIINAIALNEKMKSFKKFALNQLEGFRTIASEYGDIRSNSKGGFSLRNSDTQEAVSLDRNVVGEYDERAAMAEDLIKEFLEDKVKKKDLATFRTIITLIERNKAGDLTPSQVAKLLKIKDNYDDHRWVKAMELYEESFRIREISYSVSFFRKDQMGKDVAICLTFSSIPVELEVNPVGASE